MRDLARTHLPNPHPPRPALPGTEYMYNIHVHVHASIYMYATTHFEPYLGKQLFWSCDCQTGVSQQICSKTIWISPLLHLYMIVHFYNYIWVYRQSYACANSQPFPSTVYLLIYCTRRKHVCEYILFSTPPIAGPRLPDLVSLESCLLPSPLPLQLTQSLRRTGEPHGMYRCVYHIC